MSALRLTGSTSGYSEITPPAIAGDQTFTLPGTGGTLTTTNGGQTIEHAAGTASAPSITFTGDVNTGIFSPAADTIAFAEGGVEAARIDSSGRLLVGTSTSETINGDQFKFQVKSTDASAGLVIHRSQTTTSPPYLALAKSRSGAIVSSGDAVGSIVFVGHDGDDLNSLAASIECLVDGTPGANDMPGRLVFSTTADGASSPTERMRIGSTGSLMVGTTNETHDTITNGFVVVGAGAVTAIGIGHVTGSGSGTNYASFNYAGTKIGSITQSGTTAVAYNTSSDYRLKENIVPLTSAANRLQQIPVYRFNFIADPDKTVDGFIAHEAQAVVPECVTGEKDEVDEDGNPVYQGIDQSKLVPLLTAALQEAIQKIEDLEGRLTAAGL